MRRSLPMRLRKDPLIEAIWHVVYEPSSPDISPAEVLVGILYTALRKRGREYKIQRLPQANLPAELTQFDPRLRYVVRYRFEASGMPILYQIGDRIVSVNCRRPYVGWAKFREEIWFVKQVLEGSNLVIPAKHALRYIDLLTHEELPDLSGLQLVLKIGEREIKKERVQFKVELPQDGKTFVIQVVSPAKAELSKGDLQEGTLIDLETGIPSPRGWNDISESAIEGLHEAAKSMFFSQILKSETLDRLEPEYE